MTKKLNQFDLEIKLEALQKLLNEKVAEQVFIVSTNFFGATK